MLIRLLFGRKKCVQYWNMFCDRSGSRTETSEVNFGKTGEIAVVEKFN